MGELDLILGPTLVGTFISTFLNGILVVQCYNYFIRFTNDPTWMKLVVSYILLADIVHTGVECAITYQYSVSFFGNMQKLLFATPLFASIPSLTVAVATVVQAFFAWRAAKLTRSRILGWIIAVLAILQLLGGIAVTVAMRRIPSVLEFYKFKGVVIVWFTACVLCDTIIAITLCCYLSSHRSGFRSTDDLVSRVIRLSIQTGLITSIWAILDLATFNAQNNSIHLLFCFPLPKIYSNSLLSNLNARQSHMENPETQNTRIKGSKDTVDGFKGDDRTNFWSLMVAVRSSGEELGHSPISFAKLSAEGEMTRVLDEKQDHMAKHPTISPLTILEAGLSTKEDLMNTRG